jgi:hypothetical protein
MYKIIGGDQREYGPVGEAEVRRWIAEGRLNARSLVQAEGSPDWKPLSAFAEFSEALRAQTGPTAPPFSPSLPADVEAWKAEILARPARVRIGECLSRSWELMTSNFGLLFGACAVIWGIGFCQFIPVIGFAYRVLSGALYGGLYLVFLKRIRGETARVGDVFSGFHIAFGQLVLAGFLSSLLAGIGFCFCVLPWIYLSVAWVLSVPLVADKRLEFWSAMELSRKVVTRVWFEMFVLVLISFLPVIFMALYGGVKVGTQLWPTVEQLGRSGSAPDIARMMQTILMLNVKSFSLSFLTRLVLLVNMPFAIGALMYAYENLFSPRPAPNA